MKRTILISILILTVVLSCSCVEKLDSDTAAPGLGPIETATSADSQDPMLNIDPDKIPGNSDSEDPSADRDPTGSEPTDPEASNDPSDNNNNGEPDVPGNLPLTDIEISNGVGSDGKATTTALSGYVNNVDSDPEGKVVKKLTSGNKTIYRVQYVRTMTFVVEVTPIGNNIEVEVYLEHYNIAMGKDKQVKITIGDYSASVLTGSVEWDDNSKAAKTLMAKAIAPKGEGNSIKIDAQMFFGGTYHKEKIDMMSLSETLILN